MVELSDREKMTIELLMQGKSDHLIAQELGVRWRLVGQRLRAACDKVGAQNRAQLVAIFIERGRK